jgi:hypothetical protein
MATIVDYRLGHVLVDGREETRDVIVLPHRVVSNWWRVDGHSLVLDDLDYVLDELPERLIVGTGASSQMRPDPSALDRLRERGVQVECLPTDRAGHPVRRAGPRLDGCGATPHLLSASHGARASQTSSSFSVATSCSRAATLTDRPHRLVAARGRQPCAARRPGRDLSASRHDVPDRPTAHTRPRRRRQDSTSTAIFVIASSFAWSSAQSAWARASRPYHHVPVHSRSRRNIAANSRAAGSPEQT